MKTTVSKRWAQSGKGRHNVPQVPVRFVGAGWGGSGADDTTISVHLTRTINEATGEYESLWLRCDVEAAEALARQLLDKVTVHRDYYAPKVTP